MTELEHKWAKPAVVGCGVLTICLGLYFSVGTIAGLYYGLSVQNAWLWMSDGVIIPGLELQKTLGLSHKVWSWTLCSIFGALSAAHGIWLIVRRESLASRMSSWATRLEQHGTGSKGPK